MKLPNDNEAFVLELKNFNPRDLPKKLGYSGTWSFDGPQATEGKREFELLNLGYCTDLAEAKKKADEKGYILAEGEWIVPFQEKFPKNTRGEYVAVFFGGSGWVHPCDDRGVPYLFGDGEAWDSRFCWSGSDFGEGCRWLGSRKSDTSNLEPSEPRPFDPSEISFEYRGRKYKIIKV